MFVKVNDTVKILSGADKGKQGKVLSTSPNANKVIVEGLNIKFKHRKARKATDVSAKTEVPGPIDASDVMVVCSACGKATRVAYSIVNGKRARICKKCGAGLDKAFKKETKGATATKKKAVRKRAAKPAEETPTAVESDS